MDMISVPITVPRDMAPLMEEVNQKVMFERNAMMLYPFIQNMTISHGRAAEILGVHKFTLIDFYNKMGIPYLNQSAEDLDEELAGFARLREKRAI